VKRKSLLIVLGVVLVCVLVLALVGVNLLSEENLKEQPNILVGVDVGYGDESDVYRVADAVQGYANLIIIGSLNVTSDPAKLTRVCDYLYDKGFSFIVFVGYGPVMPKGPDPQFFNTTVKQWGSKFLGAYIFDEPGGKQLDYSPGSLHYIDKPIKQASNYTDAAEQYVKDIYSFAIDYAGPTYYDAPNLEVFTSDYALYWFDYLSGYNAVLAQFVGNQSRQIAISLCRGAANVQGRSWGAIITFSQGSTIENPQQLYSDMVLAFENDAKYIVVFDSSSNQTSTPGIGLLTAQHLDSMKRFWTYAIAHPRVDLDPAEVAYVLPADFGFGFRGTNDTVWGLTFPLNETDSALQSKIWNDTNNLVAQYGEKLDIVYENLVDGFHSRLVYDGLIYYNGTIVGKI